LITLTRRLARQIHDVLRRALPKPVDGIPRAVLVHTDGNTLLIRAWSHQVAVEYREAASAVPEQIAVPLDALKQCTGSRSEPVTVERSDGERVVLRWNDLGIPQVAEFDSAQVQGEYPLIPENMEPAGDGFLAALRDAIETTDPESIRYALNCVRLRGKIGRIDATDSRQALIQSGFKFGWDDEVLVPANPVFRSAVFPPEAEIRVGRSENWVAFQIGAWTIQLVIDKERRFPDVDGVMPAQSAMSSRLRLSDSDARFLERALPRLPQDYMCNDSATVDLNGSVAIRARSQADAAPTELVLVESERMGEQICVNTPRRFLERAVRLGFREVDFLSAEAPAICSDGRRRYAWAVLSPDAVIPASAKAIRIESSPAPQYERGQSKRSIKADAISPERSRTSHDPDRSAHCR
jgi:hypothetical protein